MKNLALLTFLFLTPAVFSNIFAQAKPDGDLRDNNIRMRSNDLERTKRDAAKSGAASPLSSEIDKKYPEIKEDFENIQLAQKTVVKAYTTGEKIDYAQIEKSAKEIAKNAERLKSNLFVSETTTKKEKNERAKAKNIKDLIVDLDNTIGSFVSSAMFQNLRVIDRKAAEQARIDLENILKVSRELSNEAAKMK